MVSSIVAVLVNLIALPFYLRFLGMEAYGLIGFYVTLQAVFQVLDLGLAPTVSREIAHNSEIGQQRRSASMLHTLGAVYLCVAVLIAAAIGLASPWIGAHWFQSKALSDTSISYAIMLMGVNLACRWPLALYHGALIGAHRLATSAAISISFNILSALVSIAVLAFGARNIHAFFVAQASVGFVQTIVMWRIARGALGHSGAPFDFSGLRGVFHFSVWMSGIAITSLVFTQLDKVLMSRMVDLESFGLYMLACMVVSGITIFTIPVFNVIYPKFTTMYARGDMDGLAKFYSETSRMYAAAVTSLALALVLHGRAVVSLWTGQLFISDRIAPLIAFLAVGSALNGLMYFPYALQLAAGKPRIPFAINVSLLVFAFPSIVWLVANHGSIGGALSWATLGVLSLLVGTTVTGRRVVHFAGTKWLVRDIAIPFTTASVAALVGYWVSRCLVLSPLTETMVAATAAMVGILAGSLYSPFARQLALDFFGVERRPLTSR